MNQKPLILLGGGGQCKSLIDTSIRVARHDM